MITAMVAECDVVRAENARLRRDLAGVRADLEISYGSTRTLEAERNALRDDLKRLTVAVLARIV